MAGALLGAENGIDRALDTEGDYVMWGAGLDHSWWAGADSIVIRIRRQSKP
jgi:hypothetical protein